MSSNSLSHAVSEGPIDGLGAAIPSLRQILLVVAIPAIVAAVDHVAFASGHRDFSSAASYGVLLLLIVGQVALLAYTAARWIQPKALQWLVFVWSAVLMDLVVFSAMLSTPDEWQEPDLTELGYALLAGQLSGLMIWLILGDSSWPWRIAASLLTVGVFAVLVARIAVAHRSWQAYVWPMILLAQGIVVVLTCGVMRLLGIKMRPLHASTADASRDSLRFSLHHALVWTTAVCLLLVVLKGVDWVVLHRLESGELISVAMVAVSLALASIAALWAALGRGKWFLRLFILIATATACGWIAMTVGAASNSGWIAMTIGIPSSVTQSPLIRAIHVLGSSWIVWHTVAMCLLAAQLLFFRAQGLRVARRPRHEAST